MFRVGQSEQYSPEWCVSAIAVVTTSDQVTPAGEMLVEPGLSRNGAEQHAKQDSRLVFVTGQGVAGQRVGQGTAGLTGRDGQRADAEATSVAEFAQMCHELRFRVHRCARAAVPLKTAVKSPIAIPAAMDALVPAKVSSVVNAARTLRQTI
ncbi:MAG TPA: hypothetical protein VFG15_31800 [Amycolatopsis sp.]|nr:hypothetical protein [Amycolatopsis sp.]